MKGSANSEKAWNDKNAFSKRVRLGAAQSARLSDDELPFVLAYELEPVSGIPAQESEVGWREVASDDPSVRQYDVRIRRREERGAGPSRRFKNAAAALVAAATVAAVAVDAIVLSGRTSAMRKELAARSVLAAEISSLDESARSMRREAEAIRSTREASASAARKTAALRSSYSRAMNIVASVCISGGKSFVRRFSSPAPFELEIKAISENAQTASATMSALARAVESEGWRLLPGKIESEGVMSSFVCTIDMGGGGR